MNQTHQKNSRNGTDIIGRSRSASNHTQQTINRFVFPYSKHHSTSSSKTFRKPELVYPKPRTQIMRQIPPTTLPLPTTSQQPGLSMSRPIPTPRMTNTQRPTIIRCFKCNDPNHIKWHCPRYRCQGCRRLSPGHALCFCPDREYQPSVSHYGNYEHDYGTNFGGSN